METSTSHQQQRHPLHHPQYHFHNSCAISIGLGVGLVASAPTSQQIYVEYTNKPLGATTVTFTLTQTLSAPVYMYYGFKGFYQNHRRFLKYYSSNQLTNGQLSPSSASTDCGDYVTNAQTFGSTTSYVSGAPALNSSAVAFPCGTIARVYYQLYPQIHNWALTLGGTPITMTQSGIAWPSDIGRHKKPSDPTKAGFDVTDQTWLVWFRPAARSDFYKLNYIINQDLAPGTYSLAFTNSINPTWGEKWISLSKSNFVGNRDLFLGIAFLVLGGGCVILLLVFMAKWISEKRDRQKHQ